MHEPIGGEGSLRVALARGVVDPGLAQRLRIVAHLEGGAASNLERLEKEAVSGQTLGEVLGLSRAAVHKHIDHLRSLGFVIESVVGLGYRLAAPFTDLLAAEAVLPFLLPDLRKEQLWMAGLPYLYRQECDSTNRVIRQVIKDEASPPGMVVVTDHQTHGRGRLDRVWRDQVGKDLMFSLFLRPSIAPGQAHLLSLAAALAVAETVEAFVGLEETVSVKWPNDVMIGDRKACGILLEGAMDGDRLRWVIVGVGLNVNSDPAVAAGVIAREDHGSLGSRPWPVSLHAVLGSMVPRAPLLVALLRRLTARCTDLEQPGGMSSVLESLAERDFLAGRHVEVFQGGDPQRAIVGEAAGIGAEGQLLVRLPSGGVTAVFAGDVNHTRQRR
ncbi:MAG: biotin--[acetyl-CoA-carboxylase] ligase [Thermoleophilia bacterium]|jgi:BirA family biotin operon repressor/biotin-[acetyl-CoA-carboxylase] ligase